MAVALAACALGFAGAVARGLARRGALIALCTPGFEEAVLEDLARLPRTRVLCVDRPPDRATGAAVASTIVFATAARAPQLAGALRHVQELLVLVASTSRQAATAAAFERWAGDITAACWHAAVRRWAELLGFPLGERLVRCPREPTGPGRPRHARARPAQPSFRCEGVRSGAHDFGSQEAAALAAEGLERLGCPVRLQDHDLEVGLIPCGALRPVDARCQPPAPAPQVRVLVRDGYGLLGLCLGRDQQRSGRKRGGVELLSLGLRPSSGDRHGALRRSYGIRPSTAALLLRLAGAGRGDIIFDPTCGTGAIPIEAASSGDRWALGSDADGSAVEQAAKVCTRARSARVPARVHTQWCACLTMLPAPDSTAPWPPALRRRQAPRPARAAGSSATPPACRCAQAAWTRRLPTCPLGGAAVRR